MNPRFPVNMPLEWQEYILTLETIRQNYIDFRHQMLVVGILGLIICGLGFFSLLRSYKDDQLQLARQRMAIGRLLVNLDSATLHDLDRGIAVVENWILISTSHHQGMTRAEILRNVEAGNGVALRIDSNMFGKVVGFVHYPRLTEVWEKIAKLEGDPVKTP